MSVFTEAELQYLASQRLGRLATIGTDGRPHNVPVTFRHNPDTDTVDIGGHGLADSKKFRDVGRNPRVAFVVDDVLPPWEPRMIEIRGDGEQVATGGRAFGPGFDDAMIRIRPSRIVSFGLRGDPGGRSARDVPSEGAP